MTADIEQIKKKIIYRSNYRGTKEMDKLLGAFTRKYLDQLNGEDLNQLIKLLEIDDNNLYKNETFFEYLKITNLINNDDYANVSRKFNEKFIDFINSTN